MNQSLRESLHRGYVLAVLSAGSFAQCLVWFTYGSVDDAKFRGYYSGGALPGHLSKTELDFQVHLLLNWGPICGVLGFPLQGWLLARPGGLRATVRFGLTLTVVGAVLRLVPTVVASKAGAAGALLGDPGLSLACLHGGQMLVALSGPFVMGCVSRLAVLWFPESQRVAATAVASTASGFGVTIGFPLGPWLVPTAADYPVLLTLTAAVAVCPWICAMLHYPDAPARPPSASAAAWAGQPQESFGAGLHRVLADRTYGTMVLAAGVLAGAGTAWQAVLHDILTPLGYSDDLVGYLGFSNALAMNVGAVAMGLGAHGSRSCRQRFKLLICMGLVLMFVSCLLWAVACQRSPPPALLLAFVGLLGLGNGLATPLFFELAAELTYPAPEGTSAGVLVCIMNLASLLLLFLPSTVGQAMNWIYAGLVAGCAALLLAVRERHLRPADGAAASRGAGGGLPALRAALADDPRSA